ncbi:aldo/keto reductase [Litorivicinus sp.]|nr:aldo/keto reductase [Litorivicinus sp.]MDB9862223.1 aldo/keto reductase [Litorivicinus sp.]MDC1208849.1 aldo/keto reductase [Litorivicinus sp.]MDC1239569.1 aldo/keto reductase [Litorivicinus sp.]
MGLETRSLGRTGINLSTIGLGTIKIGRNTNVKYPERFQLPSDEEVITLLKTAAEIGINCLDTAPAYGQSEARLGTLLASINYPFQIITKVGENYSLKHGSRYDFSDHAIQKSLELSLKRLRRDQLDVVLLHSDGDDLRHIESGALKALIDARERGLVKAVGLSGKTLEGGRRALQEGADCLMITLNAEMQEERALLDESAAFNAGILVKKVFGSGYLAHDPKKQLLTLLSHPNVTSAIIGTLNPEHLRHNCESLLVGINP